MALFKGTLTAVVSLLAASCLATGALAVGESGSTAVASNSTIIPGAYIVELDDGENADTFYRALGSDLGLSDVRHRRKFQSKIFHGVSFTLPSSSSSSSSASDEVAQNITDLPQVKRLWPVSLVAAPKVRVSGAGDGSSDSNLARRDTTAKQEDIDAAQRMTQVDKMQAAGYRGKGLRIGIVDTGVDWKHPALGGCFGEGCVIAYGADLVGDAFDGTNTPVPDSDPWEECNGHGTHVAGIVAAQKNPLGFLGTAPDATLGMYRVFGCSETSSEDALLAGIIQAFEDGSDIITGSIGSHNGWADHPLAVATSRLVEAGVPCTFASGNSGGGSDGAFSTATPATGRGVFSIGSVDNVVTPVYNATSGDLVYKKSVTSGILDFYASWGPTFELELKPQFCAVGGDILSTLPLSQGGYGVLSGTSMATPMAAGIVALVAEARGSLDPVLLGKLLSSTAQPLKNRDDLFPTGIAWASLAQQGAGLLQAYDAAHAEALLSVQSFSFNDTEHFVSESSFVVENTGTSAATYNVTHNPALTAMATGPIYRNAELDMYQNVAEITLEPSTFTLQPGSRAIVHLHVTQPQGLASDQVPLYSGWIDVNRMTPGIVDANTNNTSSPSTQSIPYLGVAGSMREARVFAYDRVYLSRSDEVETGVYPIANGTTFQLPVPAVHADWARPPLTNRSTSSKTAEGPIVLTPGILPTMYMWLVMGSAAVHIQVTPIHVCAVGNATAVAATDNGFGLVNYGDIAGYPLRYHTPIGWFEPWYGQLATGEWAPPGRYRLSVFALRIFGDPTELSDYDRLESAEFNIRYVSE